MKLFLLLLLPTLMLASELQNASRSVNNNIQAKAFKTESTANSQDSKSDDLAKTDPKVDDKTNSDSLDKKDDKESKKDDTDSAKKDNDTTNKESNMNETKTDPAKTFLQENSHKEGVVSLNDSLQYKVLEQGDGPKPTMHSSVTVHYEGTLLDGKEFDSSFKRNEPATFSLDQVIQGWTEVLPHMNTGSTWLVYIGPQLAYGEKGIPGVIPPNSVLVFKIKLIKVNS